MFGTELETMIEAGAGLVIGTAGDDRLPRGARAWGAAIVDRDERRIRVVYTADDPGVVENIRSGHVALNAAEVVSFRSVQYKGRVVATGPPTPADLELVRGHTEHFFAIVHAIDGNPMELLERMLPIEMSTFEMVVDDQFNQTPGPDAGAAMPTGSP